MENIINNYKYKAFISYSHHDTKYGNWLHKTLDTYRIPKELIERYPDIPTRLYPIFRDREELASSPSLSKNILDALAQSAYLIVICSPNAAKSAWVNQEIIDFKAMHSDGEERILTILIDGEPNITKEEDQDLECFPPVLRNSEKNKKSMKKRVEPIAADIRKGKDYKEFGKLKLVAGLLGVGLEELYKREEKRKRRSRQILGSIATAIILLLGLILFFAMQQRDIAKEQAKIAKDQTKIAEEKNIIAKVQTLLAEKNANRVEEELEKVKHTMGLVLLEKSQVSMSHSEISEARLYANESLKLLDKSIKYRDKIKVLLHRWKREVATFYLQSRHVRSVTFSPDGKYIAAGSFDGRISLFIKNNLKSKEIKK